MLIRLKRVSGDVLQEDFKDSGFNTMPPPENSHTFTYGDTNYILINVDTIEDLIKIMDYCADKYQCANGLIIDRDIFDNGVDITIYDGYIE